MRNKILAKLAEKFPGLSQKFLGLVADKLSKKVTEESGIDQAITDYDNAVSITELATDFQKEGDRRVTDAKKEWDKKTPAGGKTKDDDDQSDDDPAEPKPKDKGKKKDADEPPAWVKQLLGEVASLKKEKVLSTIQQKVAAKLKDKKVPEKFYAKRALPETEDGLDDFIKEIEDDWNEIKQDGVNAELEKTSTPIGGGETGTVKPSGKEEAEIKAWAEKNKPKETAKV